MTECGLLPLDSLLLTASVPFVIFKKSNEFPLRTMDARLGDAPHLSR